MRRYRYEVGYVTDSGNCRDENQDSLIMQRGSLNAQEFLLLAVADGMGGTAHGGHASRLACETLGAWWDEQLPPLLDRGMDFPAVRASLSLALEGINRSIAAAHTGDGARSGTTLSLLFLCGGRYLLLHVGDSRIYLCHRRSARTLTADQTWCQREVTLGRLSEGEAAVHPMRHVLLSALGMADTFHVQEGEGTIDPGDALLLCSDGFYNELDAALWLPSLRRAAPVQRSLEDALRTIKAGTAEDNVSAILVGVTTGWGR